MRNFIQAIGRIVRVLAFLLAFTSVSAISPARGADTEYRPAGQSVAYSIKIPTAIKRQAKQVGPTRFFGTFKQCGKSYAVHFYDTSKVRRAARGDSEGDFSRDSQLDIFQLAARNSWQLLIGYDMYRLTSGHKDRIKVNFQVMWLDPACKKTPLVYLRVMDSYENNWTGNRTDVYGVLSAHTKPENFVKFDCFFPHSMTTVYSSQISFPNEEGNLTLLFSESNPGGNNETAHGWTSDRWKEVGHADYEFGNETTRTWNGTKFVPLPQAPKAP